jgi:hypothetical protein
MEMSPTELLKVSSAELTFNGIAVAAMQAFIILYYKPSCFSFQILFLIVFNVMMHYKDYCYAFICMSSAQRMKIGIYLGL